MGGLPPDLPHLSLDEQQLNWLLSGYDVVGHRPLPYQASGL
ncbi:hypothetical protein [Alteromonas aestuariivivens]|nr:hypothetical protein [Alteromonas aestuariivivens]